MENSDTPVFTEEEMQIISDPPDFPGLNFYSGIYVRHVPECPSGWAKVCCDENDPPQSLDLPVELFEVAILAGETDPA